MKAREYAGSTRLYLLFAIFALSGFSGLIYESIWTHYLKLFLGHAAYAQTTVLAIFMGGMAFGAWLAARFSKSWTNLLLIYALVEGVVGFAGLGFHNIFVRTTDFAFDQILPGMSSPVGVQAVKYSIGSLLILPQSILLGATFPLMSAGLIRLFPERSGSTVSMLYFTNSIGAVGGALASALYLVEKVGLPGTLMTAGLINVTLALAVWLIGKTEATAPDSQPVRVTAREPAMADRSVYRLFLGVAFLTGLSSFFYEIGWIRMLAQVLGASTRAFELMLAAFILGIALGGLWIRRRIDDLENPEAFLGYVQIAMGVAAAATLPFYDRTFDIMAWALGALQRNESGYALFITVSQSIAMLVMLPATFFAGMTLPLLTYTLMRRGSGEKAIGQVYSANTVGAIVGVLCAVHLLMPMIGVKGLIIAGGLTDIGLGSILLFRARTVLVIFSLRNNVGWAVAGVILAVAIAHQTDPHYLISSVYRHGNAITNQTAEVLFLRDGKTATVSLFGHRNDYVSIATNGKVDAGINLNMNTPAGADEITMTLAGALALAYNPRAQMVANIGMGSGLTTHVLLSSDQLRRVDTVEIEPLMVRAAREGFGARAQRAFDDPRSQIHFEDAKTFFSLHQRKYDAIISEPSNPWVSGVASLFSQEFYKHVLRYLADDGVFVQWLQIYETDTRVLASVLQALSREFSDYVVYCANDSDVLIIAKKSGGLSEPDWQALSSPFIAKELNRVGINSLDDIRRRLLADEKVLAPLLSTYGSPVNSDFFPFVDQHAPRALFLQRDALELTRLTLKPIPLTEMLMRRPQGDATGKPTNSGVFSRDALGEMAVAMRDGALDANRTASASLRKSLRIILAWAENCSKSPDGVWLDSFQEVAGSAVAQLRPQELAQMFEAWVPPRCSAMLSEQQSQWLAFYKAMGQRDGTAMASAADSLLALAKDLDGNQRGLLFTSGLLGKLAEGNKQGAAAMWNTYAPAIVGNGSPSLPLRLLAAHALTGS